MKELKFILNGVTVAAGFDTKITKDDLYGGVVRFVEKDGQKLEKGYLLPDGRLLRRSQLSSIAVDDDGTTVEPGEMLAEDQPVEQRESSFDAPVTLNPVPLQRLVGFNTSDVYALDPGELKPGLYETTFNYRKSYQPREALVLVKENNEAWLLTGAFKRTTFVSQTPSYEFFDSADDSSPDDVDPLDFSMM